MASATLLPSSRPRENTSHMSTSHSAVPSPTARAAASALSSALRASVLMPRTSYPWARAEVRVWRPGVERPAISSP
jgi:hypothetical protein